MTDFSAIESVLERHPEIRLAYVFGSVANADAGPDSDLDVAVQADGVLDTAARVQLVEAFAAATGRPVDLIDLRLAGEPLLGEILKHGVRLKGDRGRHAELLSRHIQANQDFMPYVRRLLAERRRSWTN